jgi:hypothetical protein
MPKPLLIEMLDGGRERAVMQLRTGNIFLVENVNDTESFYRNKALLATTPIGCRALGEALIRLADRIQNLVGD